MNRNFFEEALAFDVRHAFLNPAEFGVPMNCLLYTSRCV